MYLCRDAGGEAALPRKRSCQPVFDHHRAPRNPARRCYSHHCQRKCKSKQLIKLFLSRTDLAVDFKICSISSKTRKAAVKGQVQECRSSRYEISAILYSVH